MSEIVIQLSGNLDGLALSRLVQSVRDQHPHVMPNRVAIDFARLTFVRPAGVTFLSNFIQWLVSTGAHVELRGLGTHSAPISYLDDSLFFQQHLGRKIRDFSQPRSTTLPLQRIQSDHGFSWLRTDLVPWLAPRISVTQASLHPFQTCIAEIFHNIRDHSAQTIGSVFVQHFPKADEVSISIADFGRGIPSSVRTVLPHLSDEQAIIEAVREGFTAKSTQGNYGIGLDYLLKTVVLAGRGSVTIHSLGGHVLFTKLRNNINATVLPVRGWCPGTTIDISFRTDSIVMQPEETEELLW